jgi:hypothetical protein
MTQEIKNTWWDLHLKKARGEPLTETERQLYEAELARHDEDTHVGGKLAILKKLRAEITALGCESDRLRARINQLETAIQTAEKNLSQETRKLLGVQE